MSRRHLMLAGAALLALVALLVGLRSCLRSTPETEGPVQVVPDSTILKSRPRPPKTITERVLVHRVAPQVSVSRGTPDTVLVRRYAATVALADSLRRSNDSLRKAGKPPLSLPSILSSAWGQWDGKHFKLWMSRSDGAVMRATVRLHPHFAFIAGVDAATDSVPRFYEDTWFVRAFRQTKKCSVPTALLATAGGFVDKDNRLRGALVGGASGLLGCLVG